jgi:predicted RNA polymerase sigma factor
VADIGILRAAIAPVRRLWRRPAAVEIAPKVSDDEQDARVHFRDGLVKRRGGDAEGALAAFDRALALTENEAERSLLEQRRAEAEVSSRPRP